MKTKYTDGRESKAERERKSARERVSARDQERVKYKCALIQIRPTHILHGAK